MTGLRARKQQARWERILDVAATLFAEKGYRDTHVTDIARRANLSAATVYNYFSTKRNIVLGLAVRHIRQALPERLALLKTPPANPLEAVCAYENLLVAQSTRILTRDCWRVIFGTLYEEPGGEAHRTAMRLNQILHRHYTRMLNAFQRRGRIAADVDTDALASLIVGIGTFHWMNFLADESVTADELKSRVNGQLAIVFRGAAPDRATGREQERSEQWN